MKRLVSILCAFLSFPLSAATGVTWGPACTEWHFSPDNMYPIAIWSVNTYEYGTCFADRDWTQSWSGMTEPNHCNPPPNFTVTMDLTQMGVAADAKEAIFEGIIIGTPSTTTTNDTVISIAFCAASDQSCDLSKPMVYSISQGSTVVAIGSRAPTTVFATVENGAVKYRWGVKSTPALASDEYFGVSMRLAGWCR